MPMRLDDAQHVAIDRQPGHAERVTEDDVGGLAADAGQLVERVHRRGHLAAVLLDRPRWPCRASDFDFARKKPVDWICGSSSRGRRLRERTRVGIALEERRRDLVHALVGALRREDRRDEQLVRRRVMQLGVGVGVLRLELLARMARVSAADFGGLGILAATGIL